MKKLLLTSALILAPLASPLAAQEADPADNVSQDRLRADIARLVGFGTRHTLSAQDDPNRGIGAAVDWGVASFRGISQECGGCLQIVIPTRYVTGNRIPDPVRIRNAVAIQRGTERPNEVVIVQGHIDSRASDVMDAVTDAPGANDDASGVALTIEAARVLSKQSYPVTIVYALLSGEEQGLFGGQLMADYAAQQGWDVKAVLNNDIVGDSIGSDGYRDDMHVRVFSEGPRADLSDRLRSAQRREGGENDSPSRNLSRYIAKLAEKQDDGLDVRQIWRADRMGRGGDQLPFLDKGYPAVRFSVAVENYDWQHQNVREEGGTEYGDTLDKVDFPYLAKVTQLNVRVLEDLARTPAPPIPTADAAVRNDTLVQWQGVKGANLYRVAKRRTTDAAWQDKDAAIVYSETPVGAGTPMDKRTFSYTAPVRGDDWIFGVAACSAGGLCSPYASAVPAGQFAPVATKDDMGQ